MSIRRFLIAGNWKMNGVGPGARSLAAAIAEARGREERVDMLVAPPFTEIATVRAAIDGTRIQLGAQNMHHENTGAFTGEVSGPMIEEAGCRYVILGHSERRSHFGESDAFIRLKVLAAIKGNLNPILCVGETLAQREAGSFFDIVRAQVERAAGDVDVKESTRLVVAYEPVWAIGTGRTASPQQAQEMHAFVRSVLKGIFGSGTSGRSPADNVRILYGGSVTPENAAGILAGEDVDGALVGGASLKVESFVKIIDAAVAAGLERKAAAN